MALNVDDLRQRIYALADAETEIRDGAFESTSLIGGGHDVECDANGCRLIDRSADLAAEAEAIADAAETAEPEPPRLRMKGGWSIDLVKLDEIAYRLGLDDLWIDYEALPRKALADLTGNPDTNGIHGPRRDDPTRHYVAIANDLPPADAARVLAHEIAGHALFAKVADDHGEGGYALIGREFDAECEEVAEDAERLAPMFREAFLDVPDDGGRAPRGRGAARHVPANRPPDHEWPQPQRVIRHDQDTAIRRVEG